VTVDETIFSDESVNHVDCDRVDAFDESVLDEEGVDKTVVISYTGFPLFRVDTEPKTDGGPADDWEDAWKLELT